MCGFSRTRLQRRRCCDIGLDDGGLSGDGLRAALKQPQAVFELAIAVLQLLVLASELTQLILELLNAHFRIDILGLRRGLRCQRQHRNDGSGAGNSMKPG